MDKAVMEEVKILKSLNHVSGLTYRRININSSFVENSVYELPLTLHESDQEEKLPTIAKLKRFLQKAPFLTND